MGSANSDSGAEDSLELERIAVGPYCVLDGCKAKATGPDLTQNSSLARATTEVKMDDMLVSGEYQFAPGLRNPWMASGEEPGMGGPSPDNFLPSDWSDFMRWDAASQTQSPKPLNAQGPLCYIKPDQKTSNFVRRQDLQPGSQSFGMTSSDSGPGVSAPDSSFTFGTPVTLATSTPFRFNGTPAGTSSPTTASQPAYSSNMWPPAPSIDQSSNSTLPLVPFAPLQQLNGQFFTNVSNPPQSTPSLQHSPSSLTNARTSPSSLQSSPEPVARTTGKKRKSHSEADVIDATEGKHPPVKKTAHNMIEKRYRNNLNDKIAALRDSVPSLRVMSRTNPNGDEDDDGEDLEGLTPAHKLNKATVLSKATEYIRHLEKRNKRLTDELDSLKARMDHFEKMALSGAMTMSGAVNTPDGIRYQEDPFSASVSGTPTSQPGPQGMIPVPESMINLHRITENQPHYASQQDGYPVYTNAPPRSGLMAQHPIVNGRRSNGLMSKLMVGSLAGLMIMEGFKEREKSSEEPEGRGLFALPFNLIARLGGSLSSQSIDQGSPKGLIPFLRIFLIIGALMYLVSPFLVLTPRAKKKAIPLIRLSPAPSLASPVEVRRKAWLTAIQTVWVPQHSFLPEFSALCLKALKLSTRRVIGWPAFAFLTGTTKEQEVARVKAWEIALDAQLTGGDAEISMSRLVLTIMASGTLPDTPARLMLKALHVRVLLWEVAKAGYGTWYMFEDMSAKAARSYWNSARDEHRMMANSSNYNSDQIDALPDHLAALIELECDDVLVDSIIQRAYNLAWNKPSAEIATGDATMDSVVDDFAISSPLDALAAWWSSHALSRALLLSLDMKSSQTITEDVNLAIRTAPPTSSAHIRALVTRAVLFQEDRNAHIVTAYQALPSQHRGSVQSPTHLTLINAIKERPISPDVHTALTLAKCLYLGEQSHEDVMEEARMRATSAVNSHHLSESNFSQISFVAAFMVLNAFSRNAELLASTGPGLERLASSLRVLVGRQAGKRLGLSSKTRGRIIEECLDVSKMLVGMEDVLDESDHGYASSSDVDDREVITV